jgi:hypothetical protein
MRHSNNISKEKELPPYDVDGWVPTPLLGVTMEGNAPPLESPYMDVDVIIIGMLGMGGLNPPLDIADVGVWVPPCMF